MTQLSVRGVSIDFPFEPYECQKAFMEKVIECLQREKHGILESPTGTGKTLCLLCSSLAWLQGRKAQVDLNKQMGVASLFGDKENLQDDLMKKISSKLQQSSGSSWGTNEYVVPKIIYASRTHSQLSQAVQELKRTTYNTVNSCVLGSREQLCIDEKVSKETNNTSKVHMCRAKVQARRCHYYNMLDDMKKTSEARQILGSVVDIEDLVSKGKKNNRFIFAETMTDSHPTSYREVVHLLDLCVVNKYAPVQRILKSGTIPSIFAWTVATTPRKPPLILQARTSQL